MSGIARLKVVSFLLVLMLTFSPLFIFTGTGEEEGELDESYEDGTSLTERYGGNGLGQSFTPGVDYITKIEIYGKRVGTATGAVSTVSLCEDDGGEPGNVLASKAINVPDIGTGASWISYDITDTEVTPGTKYWISVIVTGGSFHSALGVYYDTTGEYDGTTYCLSTYTFATTEWTANTAYDMNFREYGYSTGPVDDPPTIISISPGNNTAGINTSGRLSAEINELEGEPMRGWINCSDGNTYSFSAVNNGTYQMNYSGLHFNTEYSWWINVTDGKNWTREWQKFTTWTIDTNADSLPTKYEGSSYTVTANGSIDLDNVSLWYRYASELGTIAPDQCSFVPIELNQSFDNRGYIVRWVTNSTGNTGHTESSVVCEDNLCYLTSNEYLSLYDYGNAWGEIFCIYINNGTVKWHTDTGCGDYKGPSIHGDYLLCCENNHTADRHYNITKINKYTGEIVWKQDIPWIVHTEETRLYTNSSGSYVLTADGLYSDDLTIVCLNWTTGKPVWYHNSSWFTHGQPCSSFLYGDCWYVGLDNSSQPSGIAEFNITQQKITRRVIKEGTWDSNLIFDYPYIYHTNYSDETSYSSFNRTWISNFTDAWSHKYGDFLGTSPPQSFSCLATIGDNKSLIVIDRGGKVHRSWADTGIKVWIYDLDNIKTGSQHIHSATYADGLIYGSYGYFNSDADDDTADAFYFALNATDGSIVWVLRFISCGREDTRGLAESTDRWPLSIQSFYDGCMFSTTNSWDTVCFDMGEGDSSYPWLTHSYNNSNTMYNPGGVTDTQYVSTTWEDKGSGTWYLNVTNNYNQDVTNVTIYLPDWDTEGGWNKIGSAIACDWHNYTNYGKGGLLKEFSLNYTINLLRPGMTVSYVLINDTNADSEEETPESFDPSEEQQTDWGAWTRFGIDTANTSWSWSFTFPEGSGYYEFYTIGAENSVWESAPSGNDTYTNFTLDTNYLSLSSPSIAPTSGVAVYTVFYFNITWASTQGNDPTDGYLKVNISRTGWNTNQSMSYLSGDNTSDAEYTYSSTLTAGSYTVYFYGYDGTYYNKSGPHSNPSVSSQTISFTISTSSLTGDLEFMNWTLTGWGVGYTTEYNVSEDNQTAVVSAVEITNTGNVPINISMKWLTNPGSGITMKYAESDTAPNPGISSIAVDPSETDIITNLAPSDSKKIWLWMDFVSVEAQDNNADVRFTSEKYEG